MKDFNKTFNMVISVQNSNYDFDISDNPYVSIEANKATSGWVTQKNEDIQMRKCTPEEL